MRDVTFTIVNHVSAVRTFSAACTRLVLRGTTSPVVEAAGPDYGRLPITVQRMSKVNETYLTGVADAINDLCK